jgi:serine/threonine protein kinase
MTQLPEPPDPPTDGRAPAVRRVGPYRLLRRVATGGMSSVYQAFDESAGRTVALKLLADDLSQKPEFVRRFRREARITQLLNHAHIVRGLDSGFDRESGKHYLAMAFVAGPTAAASLAARGPLPVPVVARIALDTAAALGHLHGVLFVHRDVKPENILLDPDGSALLADYGLVRKIDGQSDLTASNQGVGTPYYMPHEQAQNSSFVDGRSDLFSLGATLYHLVTGALPFPGETQEEIEAGKKSGAFLSARVANAAIPVAFDRILSRLLDRDVRRRYQSASELIADVTATGLAATPAQLAAYTRHAADADTTISPLAPTRADLPASRPTVRNSKTPQSLAVLGLVAVLGLGSWAVFPRPLPPCACDGPACPESRLAGTTCRPDETFPTDRRQPFDAVTPYPAKS